ncbi:SDR family oxidoreductase [Rhodococcus sp. CX]|uniref:SDR family oxidoreductase n=1 Tax=Rhodococcus sp. CX TaxID=2789880 RepID=UPI0018CD2B26|nr:SDR family oxidoreductase [Rhodococcus sp. CX]MBH0123528.1 SDR family oxidoreductase [Rhodococcus sp. CX]
MTTVGVVTGAGRGMGYACAQRLSGTVDVLLLADRDAATVATAAEALAPAGAVEPIVLDITDGDALARLADRVSELGTLRAVAHAAGISPTMADWRQIFTVDLVATAMLAETLRPLATAGTATVCFASMAGSMAQSGLTPEVAEVLDDPLGARFLDRIRDAAGPTVEHSGAAYALAKLGVQRFVRREAVRLGPRGARICSVSPGIIDTPQGRQEAEHNPRMGGFVQQTPLGRTGRADEVAAVVAFALSDDAGFLSGTDLLVDGGVCAAMST